jgi:hypothetical protein
MRLQRKTRVLGWQQHPLASLLGLLRKVGSSICPRRLALLGESCLPPSLPISSSASRVPEKVRRGIRQRCRGRRGTESCGWSRVARVQGRVLVCMAVR